MSKTLPRMRSSNARQPKETLAFEPRSFRMPKLRFSREVFQLGNPGNTKHAQTRLTISAASAAAIGRLSARRRRNTSTRSIWAEGCEHYDRHRLSDPPIELTIEPVLFVEDQRAERACKSH